MITDNHFIATRFLLNEEENDAFRVFIQQQDAVAIDAIVHDLNKEVAPQIDCTLCGACCSTLMINVSGEEASRLSSSLGLTTEQFKTAYIEESQQGQMIMNSMPCSFLSGKKCSVYADRFEECRQFPHLHKNNFKDRLFGTLMHYGRCPIIYNVIEMLKVRTGFKTPA